MTEDRWFYKTEIVVNVGSLDGISYKTLQVKEKEDQELSITEAASNSNSISNERYTIEHSADGILIFDKKLGKTFENILYLEDGGDEGDSYDYSYPDKEIELVISNHLAGAEVKCVQTSQFATMCLEGEFMIPGSLETRAKREMDTPLHYEIVLELDPTSPIIRVHGSLLNQAKDHRVRLGIRTGLRSQNSYAGTQFGYVKRPCVPQEFKDWREKGFFEEPCNTRPLLNHVSAVGEEYTLTVFTRGLKEYQFTGDNFSDINLTLFRSMGYVGLPDLNRRPGRPSGLANKIFPSPEHQLLGENTFDFGVAFYPQYDGNQIMRDYAEFAVDPMCFQDQDIDKTLYPIAYFPINPLEKRLPRTYKFLSLDNFKGSFGTVRKTEKQDGYLLQIFNSEESVLEGGELELGFDCSRKLHVNLLEEPMSDEDQSLTMLTKGELKNVLLVKGELK